MYVYIYMYMYEYIYIYIYMYVYIYVSTHTFFLLDVNEEDGGGGPAGRHRPAAGRSSRRFAQVSTAPCIYTLPHEPTPSTCPYD